LIPSWSRDGRNTGKLINARRETISTQTSFRIPIRRRRCLVLADSFYEWKKVGTNRIPYRIQLTEEKIMVMAGIWDEWYKDDYALKSFAIITTQSNREMSEINDRMPVILALSLLNPLPDNNLEFYKISQQINSTIPNTVDLHKVIS